MDKAEELRRLIINDLYLNMDEDMATDTLERIDEYAQQVSSPIIGMLKIARCPNENCDNNGTITTAVRGEDGLPEPEAEQCQWCDERNKLTTETNSNDT